MRSMSAKILVIFLLVMFLVMVFNFQESIAAPTQKTFKVVWSIYAGWQPWDYAQQSGILKKWADKYGIIINLARMDYIPSIEAFVAKKADACVMTNMEALDMPAASGISTTSIIVGDYSNGNDAVLTRNALGIKGLSGKPIYIVELSVSHYLLARALEINGLKESDVTLVNTSDSDIAPAFIANKKQEVVVTWNPLVMKILQEPGITKVFDSSKIPGEILDLMVVRTDVLQANPELGKALTGAWYEVMALMSKPGPKADEAMTIMAQSAGCSLIEYKAQLKTTAMFYDPKQAAVYSAGAEMQNKMNYVRNFCFKHRLLGENAQSVDEVGIRYPGGKIQGRNDRVRLIFDDTYMKLSASGKL